MKERPILFSGPMVRAILDGRKTMTRRVVKVHDQRDDFERQGGFHGAWEDATRWTFNPRWDERLDGKGDPRPRYCLRCPYGAPGDRLWVRESFRLSAGASKEVHYAASVDDYTRAEKGPWKPSIHMPRWASRITLEVTGVRVERVQEISGRDVEAEGVEIDWDRVARMQAASDVDPEANVRASFACLWDGINGKRSPWSSNPWVWVIDFKVVKP
jgi:hypothetical protein